MLPVGDWYDGQAKKSLPMNYGVSANWIHSRIATFKRLMCPACRRTGRSATP